MKIHLAFAETMLPPEGSLGQQENASRGGPYFRIIQAEIEDEEAVVGRYEITRDWKMGTVYLTVDLAVKP